MEKFHKDKEINKILNELHEEHPIFEELKFNEFDAAEKQEKQPYLYMHYMNQRDKEQAALEKLEELFEALVGKRYNFYRFEHDQQLIKPEIEKYYLPSDPKIRKFKRIIRKQEARVKFFDACARAIDKQGWAIKNFIELHKSL